MKYIFFFLTFLIFKSSIIAQNSNTTIVSSYGYEIIINHKKLPSKQIDVLGSVYIIENWTNGRVLTINNEEISSLPLKYDLKNKELQIKFHEDVKVLSAKEIKYFELYENGDKKIYFNSRNFKCPTFRDIFIEEIIKGEKLSLYKSIEITIQKAQYVAALDAGNPSDRFIKKRSLYIVVNNDLFKLGKTKKDILSIFGDQSILIQDYSKKNNLNLKNERHLMKIVEYYNSI